MSTIAEVDAQTIRRSWLRTFRSNDAFSWPFRSAIGTCRIFYPTDGYHLTERQYNAVMRGVLSVGEEALLLSIIESEELSFLQRDWGHWSFSKPSYDAYSSLNLTLENAIYSATGAWGLVISHEMHALVGGHQAFVASIDRMYPGWSRDLELLRDAWRDNPNARWLESLLERAGREG